MSEEQFEKFYLTEFVIDEEYLEYIRVWLKYHRDCELFDRYVAPGGIPRTDAEHRIMTEHADSIRSILNVKIMNQETWQLAKINALRIVEREFEDKAGGGSDEK